MFRIGRWRNISPGDLETRFVDRAKAISALLEEGLQLAPSSDSTYTQSTVCSLAQLTDLHNHPQILTYLPIMTQPKRTRKAMLIQGPGTATVETVAIPTTLSPTDILVKTACVGLNPSDAKMVQAGTPQGSMAGLDFAGEVVSKGSRVGSHIRPGDRVCGVAFGYNRDDAATGAFAEYVVAEDHLVFGIPDGMSFQEAATLPCGLLTGGMVLHHSMKLGLGDAPADPAAHVLVYGGSTASGIFMIQLLKQ
ncbi:Protein TOXD [Colletotrichum tanaceti]|nr:Protein TOXD [Colletotrichum tanaceti]